MEDPTERVRGLCVDLPEVTERLSHGAPAWFVRNRSFAQLWVNGHHDRTFPHLWCAAPAGAQEALVADRPERFFRPPYVGHRGWLGVRLDGEIGENGEIDWDELADVCEDAYRTVAPATLIRRLPR